MSSPRAPDASYLRSLHPFLKGFTVFPWATGTRWISMLAVLAVWRHGSKRFPLRYDPLDWGAVFALGMDTACTLRLHVAAHHAERQQAAAGRP